MEKKRTTAFLLSGISFLSITLVVNFLVTNEMISIHTDNKNGNATFVVNQDTELEEIDGESFALAIDINRYSVLTKIVGVENNYVIPHNRFAYFTNVDPLRRIDEVTCSFSFSSANENTVYAGLYFSYNPLNLTDIQNGKYSDLTYICTGNSNNNALNVSLSSNEFPSMLNARYVLGIAYTKDVDVTLTSISFSTPCDTEPDEIKEVGEFANFRSHELTSLNTLLNNEEIPFMGNGSYFMENNNIIGTYLNNNFATVYENKLVFVGFSKKNSHFEKDVSGGTIKIEFTTEVIAGLTNYIISPSYIES
ncbi:MAG: hypothetical protein K6C32_00135 [Bacilli bacterium]|nr:hypothetical protein [Bacilli bacterium]